MASTTLSTQTETDPTEPEDEPMGEPMDDPDTSAHGAETDPAAAAADRSAANRMPPPAAAAEQGGGGEVKKWPGWPGNNVFRLITPVLKVGSIIGRKGELIKKLCEETRARVRILESPIGMTERVVLITGKEEPEAEISPAMDAAIRVFKRVNGISEPGSDNTEPGPPGICAVRLLVPQAQAINLIGKQGASIKSIQESSGATIRVITPEERPYYAIGEERIVEIQGETEKVLKALQGVVGHLRKFLVDRSVLPLFEKIGNLTSIQERNTGDAWANTKAQQTMVLPHTVPVPGAPPMSGTEYSVPPPPVSINRDSLFLEREPPINPEISHPGLSLYGRDPTHSTYSPGISRPGIPLVTQITQTMQIPLIYAEDLIGVGGGNISYIRANSGAVVTVQESRGMPDEITVEIKGTNSQVQAAHQLVQEFLAGHKETRRSSYGGIDMGYRSSYSEYNSSSYPSSSSLPSYYESSGLGRYSSYRY